MKAEETDDKESWVKYLLVQNFNAIYPSICNETKLCYVTINDGY